MNPKTIKYIGYASTILGVVASLVGGWVSEQQMTQQIDEKVAEAFAAMTKEGES